MAEHTDIFENDRMEESFYEEALHLMELSSMIIKLSRKKENYLKAAKLFEKAGDYRDAPHMKALCEQQARQADLDEVEARYASACRLMDDPSYGDYPKLEKELEGLGSYKDSQERAQACHDRLEKEKRRHGVRRGTVLVVAAVIAGALIWTVASGYVHVIMGFLYEKAGKSSYALASYEKLDGRFDGGKLYAACEMETLAQAKTGTTVTFGKYNWKLLERDDQEQTALLIATGLDEEHDFYGVAFQTEDGSVDWEHSSLRSWLNSEIYENGFTDEERSMILPMDRAASQNDHYGTEYEATQDYLAPMSAQEHEKYGETAGTSGGDVWIRTPGNSDDTVCFVTSVNVVRDYGIPAQTLLSVRPVMLVNLAGLDV